MKPENINFGGSVPENYDRYLGPVFFDPYANDLTARLKGHLLHDVLELACGSGIVTRHMRNTLAPAVRIVATDLNPGMLGFARQKFAPEENIEWKEADASALPFPDTAFDAVVCQFGLMFVPDKEAAMRESFRVLKPGGFFLFSVWNAIEHHPVAEVTHQTIGSFFDNDPPDFYELPFSFHDAAAIRKLLEDAGFTDIESSIVTMPCRSNSAAELAIGLVRGNPVSIAIEERGGDIDKVISTVAQKVADKFGSPVEAEMQALVFRAVRK